MHQSRTFRGPCPCVLSPAETTGPIEMLFGGRSCKGPKNRILDGSVCWRHAEYNWTRRARRRCSLMSDYFDHFKGDFNSSLRLPLEKSRLHAIECSGQDAAVVRISVCWCVDVAARDVRSPSEHAVASAAGSSGVANGVVCGGSRDRSLRLRWALVVRGSTVQRVVSARRRQQHGAPLPPLRPADRQSSVRRRPRAPSAHRSLARNGNRCARDSAAVHAGVRPDTADSPSQRQGCSGAGTRHFFSTGNASPTRPLFWTEIRAKVSPLLRLVTYWNAV